MKKSDRDRLSNAYTPVLSNKQSPSSYSSSRTDHYNSKPNSVGQNPLQSIQTQLILSKSISISPKSTWFNQIHSSQSKPNQIHYSQSKPNLFQPNSLQSVQNQPNSTKSIPVNPNPTKSITVNPNPTYFNQIHYSQSKTN
jgi:hypothetical protein